MFTFDDLEKLDQGARFYTADLHVHSFGASADVSDPTLGVTAIVDAAVSGGIGILAITDHNTDKHVHESIAYAAKYTGQILVLAGVEISTGHGHLLVYGAPEKPDAIGVLLARIGLEGEKGQRDTHTTRSMADVIAEADRLGLVCIAAHIDRAKTGFEELSDGYPNWKRDILVSPGLYALEVDDAEHRLWYSKDDAGDKGAQRLGLLRERNEKLSNFGRASLPAVQNSDSHTLAQFTAGLMSKTLTRYKMSDLTFDGFRTALVDSDARVRLKTVIPAAVPRIRGVHITANFLDGQAYRFSDNLNTFIGGRGTGKSTAIRSIAYGLGQSADFSGMGNCPNSVVVFCEDASGVRYRYERQKGSAAVARSKIGKTVQEVPLDSFKFEFYQQGELAEVAKNPLKNPKLLQAFLDRHLILQDLMFRESQVLDQLQSNSGELVPLEAAAVQLARAQESLADIEKKLHLAKEGKLQELADLQGKIAAEKALLHGIETFASGFSKGLSFGNARRDFESLRQTAGEVTDDPVCLGAFAAAGAIVREANSWIDAEQAKFNSGLMEFAIRLRASVNTVSPQHQGWEQEIGKKSAELSAQGLSGGVAQLTKLLQEKAASVKAITMLTEQQAALQVARSTRSELLSNLKAVRASITERRKAQVISINRSFKETIDDYSIYLFYETAGISDEFVGCVLDVMQGTHFPKTIAEKMCSSIDPESLATSVVAGDVDAISALAGVDADWAKTILSRFSPLPQLHRLQTTNKPPCPVIKVLTKTSPQVQIPVNELSDGQRHTILLTIAMLAESNDPLIIDQPEDDLDNAFIFKSVVKTLRYIKERRQVIVVTHNANIAVLGDSELIFPMRQEGLRGRTFDRGAIDRGPTKQAVQDILEGGTDAFLLRKAIYGV